MKKYEYKTVEIKLKGAGLFRSKRAEGFEEVLNSEGRNGWRYVDTVPQTGVYGEVGRLKLVFERETNGDGYQGRRRRRSRRKVPAQMRCIVHQPCLSRSNSRMNEGARGVGGAS